MTTKQILIFDYIKLILLLTITSSIISSCSWRGVREGLGLEFKSQDEFLVDKRDALVLPSDLSLPKPKDATLEEQNLKREGQKELKELLFGTQQDNQESAKNSTQTKSEANLSNSDKLFLEKLR